VNQIVHPSFFYLPRSVLPGSKVKKQRHMIAHGTPPPSAPDYYLLILYSPFTSAVFHFCLFSLKLLNYVSQIISTTEFFLHGFWTNFIYKATTIATTIASRTDTASHCYHTCSVVMYDGCMLIVKRIFEDDTGVAAWRPVDIPTQPIVSEHLWTWRHFDWQSILIHCLTVNLDDLVFVSYQ